MTLLGVFQVVSVGRETAKTFFLNICKHVSSLIESLGKGGSNHNSFSLTQISPRQPNPFSRTEPCNAATQVFSIQREVRTSSATSASRNAQSRHFCLGVQILLHFFLLSQTFPPLQASNPVCRFSIGHVFLFIPPQKKKKLKRKWPQLLNSQC